MSLNSIRKRLILVSKVVESLTLFFNRPHIPIFVGVGVDCCFSFLRSAIVFPTIQARLTWKMEANDKAVTGEVTVDGRKLRS